jgi:leader peptidase (prepilin peptidase)/N-methyltransferase
LATISRLPFRGYNPLMLNLLFALLGLITGSIINILADNLPEKMRLQRPYCLQCGQLRHGFSWLAVTRLARNGGRCPNCGVETPKRNLLVELTTTLLFALLPTLIPEPVNLIVNSFFIAVLILVIVIDLEHRLILNSVTFPVTLLALLASMIVSDDQNTLPSSLVGAATGFVLFFIAYQIGKLLFGPGALGYGDVKLAMAMGAMLGFHRIVFALMLAILLGGVVSILVLIISRRVNMRTYLPYGQYLAIGGIVMLIWGVQVVEWYTPG